MHWVLQSNLFVENSFHDLVEQLERQQTSYDIVKIVPFVGEIEPDVNPEGPVFVCGSTAMKKLAVRKGWTPGYFDDNIELTNIVYHFDDYFLNHEGFFTTMRHTYKFEKQIRRYYGDKVHVRPNDDKKSFAGAVMDVTDLLEWAVKVVALGVEESSTGNFTADDLIFISPLKEIWAEYRFFVVKNDIVTWSQYKRGTLVQHKPERDVDRYIVDFASAMTHPMSLDSWNPCQAYALDIADTPNGPKVLEINSINSAGFYACDMGKFVAAINDL